MNKYELLYIISSDTSEEKRDGLIAKFQEYLTSKNAEITLLEKWGTKKFAYPINFKNEGYYVLVNFTANAEIIEPMSKIMNITDGIVRQMFVKK